MHIQTLPTYSCERFYLLSEIEQRVEFVFLDEPESKTKKDQSTQNPKIDAIFLLWDARNDVCVLKNHIKKILERYPSCLSRCLIVVDCLVGSEKEFDTTVKSQVEELFDWSQRTFPGSFLFIGISDKPTGTPGLEKLEAFLRFTVDSAPAAQGNIRVIGVTRQDCLGHDPDREPDAGSDVYQVLCCRSIDSYTEWERQYKEYVQQLYGVHGPGNPVEALTGPEARGFQMRGAAVGLVVVALIVLAVSMAVQYYNNIQLQQG